MRVLLAAGLYAAARFGLGSPCALTPRGVLRRCRLWERGSLFDLRGADPAGVTRGLDAWRHPSLRSLWYRQHCPKPLRLETGAWFGFSGRLRGRSLCVLVVLRVGSQLGRPPPGLFSHAC